MAHFAKLDENNVVTQVIVVDNSELLDNGIESEIKGIEFCQSLLNGGTWVQTSYNAFGGKYKNPVTGEMTNEPGFRKNYAGIGFTFDGVGFAAPQPFPSWTLNEQSYLWEPPIPRPEIGLWEWNEENLEWVSISIS